MTAVRDQRGFSLIELMISLTILAVGLLAVAGMQTGSVKGNLDAQQVSEATTLGKGQIEVLLSLPYDHADLNAAGNPHSITNGRYTYIWNITDNNILTNTKTIQLDVTYINRGDSKQAQLMAVKPDVI